MSYLKFKITTITDTLYVVLLITFSSEEIRHFPQNIFSVVTYNSI